MRATQVKFDKAPASFASTSTQGENKQLGTHRQFGVQVKLLGWRLGRLWSPLQSEGGGDF